MGFFSVFNGKNFLRKRLFSEDLYAGMHTQSLSTSCWKQDGSRPPLAELWLLEEISNVFSLALATVPATADQNK